MEFVDTHCHIHFENYKVDKEEAYRKALEAGVSRMICVGTTLADSESAIAFAQSHEGVWATVGVHPHEAQEFLENGKSTKQFKNLLEQPKVVAVGEIGLDYYKNYSPRDIQEKVLRAQIQAAIPARLPFIFHVRDAWSDFWKIFDDYTALHGVVHSFSSGIKQLNQALDRGLYVGLNGIMTFTDDEAQLIAAKQVPLEKLMLETDAPFLTPTPLRSEVCEPKHVLKTAEFLARLRGESMEVLSKSTTDNALRLFNLK